MKYFKDESTGEVYAYDQEQIDGGWVKDGLVPMTKKETDAHLNPVLTTEKLAVTARAKRDRLIKSAQEQQAIIEGLESRLVALETLIIGK